MFLALIASALAADLPLEDALRRALDESEEVAAAELSVESARAGQSSALSSWLPQVSGSASYSHTFASEYDDLFGDTGGANPFADLPFGKADTWRLGLSASQGIYQGGRVLATRKLAEAGHRLAESQLDSARASAVLAAAQAYYDALLADRMVSILEASLARAETTLANTKLANEVGRAPDFEVLRASVTAENQRVALINQRRIQRLSQANLRRILHLPPDEPLNLVTPLGDEAPDSVAALAVELAGGEGQNSRASVVQSELAVQSAEATLGLTRSGALPYLGASFSYGLVQYPDQPFPDADWRKNVSGAVSLSVPLFSGGYYRAELSAARADAEAARERLEMVRDLADMDSADTDASLEAALAQWQATASTVAQAEKAWQIAETRYQEGISTQTELTDARVQLQQAEVNRAQAARDLQVARIRAALLPALPLSAGSGASSY